MFDNLYFELVWKKTIPFGDPGQKMFVTYYGVFLRPIFFGIGIISDRKPRRMTFKLLPV